MCQEWKSKRCWGPTSMWWFSVPTAGRQHCFLFPTERRNKQLRKTRSGDTQMWKRQTHLRSRLASFHSLSISLKIWSVNMSCLRSGKCVKTKGKHQWSPLLKLVWKVPLTVAILEDDSQHVSHQQLVVVNNPQRLHLRVHVATLFHTDGGKEQCVWNRRRIGLKQEWNLNCDQLGAVLLNAGKQNIWI